MWKFRIKKWHMFKPESVYTSKEKKKKIFVYFHHAGQWLVIFSDGLMNLSDHYVESDYKRIFVADAACVFMPSLLFNVGRSILFCCWCCCRHFFFFFFFFFFCYHPETANCLTALFVSHSRCLTNCTSLAERSPLSFIFTNKFGHHNSLPSVDKRADSVIFSGEVLFSILLFFN